jgi:hypothetical protein
LYLLKYIFLKKITPAKYYDNFSFNEKNIKNENLFENLLKKY